MKSEMTYWTICTEDAQDIPNWARTTAISANGDFYVPARLLGNERVATRSAEFDGEPIVPYRGYYLLRARWMRAEYPSATALLNVMEEHVRAAAATYAGDKS